MMKADNFQIDQGDLVQVYNGKLRPIRWCAACGEVIQDLAAELCCGSIWIHRACQDLRKEVEDENQENNTP